MLYTNFYTVAKLPVDVAEKFCAWCLKDFKWLDEKTPKELSVGEETIPCIGETIMMAPALGFYTALNLWKDQVRLAYVLCKSDIQRALFSSRL